MTPVRRQLFDIDLRPVSGSRFQPTGFPDIGPAVFDRPNGDGTVTQALLVESAQSMANNLEAAGWDTGEQAPVAALAGLSYVRVVGKDGAYLTSSRTEAHRLASAFVKDSELGGKPMREVIRERLDLRDDAPLAPRDIAAAVFRLDPMCLIHGVFFAESAKVWPGQPKIARALTGFVEALDVRPVQSGGVKRDDVRHAIGEGQGGSSEGYGSIPFHRTEWAAGRIVASFSIDEAQLRSYGLGDEATALLGAIARWEIRSLLDGGLRLRTACDLEPLDDDIRDRAGVPLPPTDALEGEIRAGVAACAQSLGGGEAIEVVWSGGKKKATSDAEAE
ncbi:MAG: type I-U CRISPR-associated RAMP protein Csb1/Cas7u [Acidimicrobiia bacterium]